MQRAGHGIDLAALPARIILRARCFWTRGSWGIPLPGPRPAPAPPPPCTRVPLPPALAVSQCRAVPVQYRQPAAEGSRAALSAPELPARAGEAAHGKTPARSISPNPRRPQPPAPRPAPAAAPGPSVPRWLPRGGICSSVLRDKAWEPPPAATGPGALPGSGCTTTRRDAPRDALEIHVTHRNLTAPSCP